MVKFRVLIISFFFSFQGFLYSQELPPINVFNTGDYGAENQNWAISQSENGFIYVANNKGLLEFNGASWQLYETPNETIIRSVKAFKEKVFTGFYMDFGFWVKNNFGDYEFSSIVKNQNVKMLEDEQIWNILEIDGWMIFKSLQRIYLYNLDSKSVKIIDAENKIHKISKVDDVIYFQEDKKGLFKIENGLAKLVSDDKILKNEIIVDVFKEDNKLLFLTQQSGFYTLEDSVLIPWNLYSVAILKNKTVYSAKRLANKSFALGTIANGLIYLNSDSSLNYEVNQDSGLSNNTVLSVFEDRDNNLWLGLDNGINCINDKSPFKINNKKNEFLGTIYTSVVYDNKIYLGTNQGLFYKEKDSSNSFQFLEGTQGQVWSLNVFDDTLFCGHDSGTFMISKNNTLQNIFRNQGTWALIKIKENLLLQGCYDGLYVLEKKNSKWSLRNKIEGFDNSSKFIVKANDTRFFVNHEYKGVFKIDIDKDYRKVTQLEKEKSLSKGIHSSIVKYQEKILYANKNGVFVFNKKANSFKKDSVYSKLISKETFISAKLIHNRFSDKLWFFSKDHIKYISLGKLSNEPELHRIPISESIPKAASGYENIIHLNDEIYLIGTSNGFIEIDLKSLKDPSGFEIHINKANVFITDEPNQKIDLFTSKNNFNFKNNNVEFFFNVPNFNKVLTTKYQYQLLGLNKSWVNISTVNSVLFKNLSSGDYTFKVRAIIGDKVSSNEAVFKFRINRAWYFSNIFIALYILLFLSAFYLVHIASKRYYKKQREELLEKAKKESELKALESEREIIKLNNEKLRNDIKSKSNELATSTMNMIKKNEFLSTIKNELVKGGDNNVPKVVKIIDKNLNNTDDWQMFQEAFNNADKKFLKKIKSMHSNLTPNDLRLCAYLRLNLSSKEIAPLLNISPRSVEVKRYRIRKKMNLPHDSNLTNYILEI